MKKNKGRISLIESVIGTKTLSGFDISAIFIRTYSLNGQSAGSSIARSLQAGVIEIVGTTYVSGPDKIYNLYRRTNLCQH